MLVPDFLQDLGLIAQAGVVLRVAGDLEDEVLALPLDVQHNNVATGFNGEPSPFSTSSEFMGSFGVTSDNYSFLDQSSEDLSAKGSGGLRQLYNYATIDFNQTIECPAIEEKQARIAARRLGGCATPHCTWQPRWHTPPY